MTGPVAGTGAGDARPAGVGLPVVWSRGGESRSLATTLAGDRAVRAGSDLARSCIEARAGLLVARRLSSFDLCSVAVPHGFDAAAVRSVVAAVGGGPHSNLAAVVADRLAGELGVPGRAVYGRQASGVDDRAGRVLADALRVAPDLTGEIVEAASPAAMVGRFAPGTLLVVGAPGGSWFQRQFFGPGARIRWRAPSGTIVVRSAPARVYQVMEEPVAFGPDMDAADAAALTDGGPVVVARDGYLVGTIDRGDLTGAGRGIRLGDLVRAGVSVTADEPIEHLDELLAGDPERRVPVVDGTSRLIGVVTAESLRRRHPG